MPQKNFQRENREVLYRSWWLANKVLNVVAADFAPTALSTFLPDPRFQERDQALLFELLAYVCTFVLIRQKKEISTSHGWDAETRKLHLNYQVALGTGLNYAFQMWEREDGVFVDLLGAYYDFDCDDDYDTFWSIPVISDAEFASKSVAEHLAQPLSPDDYNLHRLYTYRVNRIAKVTDALRFAENARVRHSGIAMQFYEDGFFGLSAAKIEKQLKSLANT